MVGLYGRTAIVTGASRGIGLATAQALAAAGAHVILTARSQAAADAGAAQIDGCAVGFEAHASDEEAAQRCVRFAVDEFGSLDILVNNAATNAAYGSVLEQDYDRFRKTVDVNLWAPLMWTALAARAWMSEHGGAVVNVASVGGLVTEKNLGVYNITKAALIHLTRQSALELGPKIRVNAVAPGIVRTRFSEVLWADREGALGTELPLGRIGEPVDVASAIAFLASDQASWTTGQTLVLDGGSVL